MFDPKQTQQSNNAGLNSNQNLTNLNAGKESPFKKIDPNAPQKKLSNGGVEDILAGSEDRKEQPQLMPDIEKKADKVDLKENIDVPAMSPHAPAPEIKSSPTPKKSNLNLASHQQAADKKNKTSGKMLTILAIILIVIVLALAGMYAYSYFSSEPEDTSSPDNNLNELLNTLDNNLNNQADNQNGDTQNQQPQDSDLPNYEILDKDSDNDGLEDSYELEIGTDPNNFDTDNDELGDFDEVNIYKSNPTNPDTDGDGYLDGNEVENGYDPLIPGSARL